MSPVSGLSSTSRRTVGPRLPSGYPTGARNNPTWRRNGIAATRSRERTVNDAASATKPAVRSTSQTRASGSRTKRGESEPVAIPAIIAPAVVTAHAGNEAMMPAIGKAKRGQGVSRTSWKFVLSDAVPIVIDAWKNDQTLKPVSANTEYGTPGWTLARFLKATKKAASRAIG